MKIMSISINNFRVIDSIRFKPKNINIIVGKNNTGKTSILEAISFAHSDYIIDKRYKSSPNSILNYYDKKGKIYLSENINPDSNNRTVSISFGMPEKEKLTLKILKDIIKIKFKEYIDIKDKNFYEKLNILNSDNITSILNEYEDNITDCIEVRRQRKVSILCGNNYHDLILELVDKIIDSINKNAGTIKDLELIKSFITSNMDYMLKYSDNKKNKDINVIFIENPLEILNSYSNKNINGKNLDETTALEIEKIIKDDNLVPDLIRFNFNKLVLKGVASDVSIDSMGDGFKALTGILLNLYKHPENSVILLEEPGVYMHPCYINEIVSNIVKISKLRNIQFFISTQSMDFIQSFLESERFSDEENDYIQKELLILKLNKIKDSIDYYEYDYSSAINSIQNLYLDLRGI